MTAPSEGWAPRRSRRPRRDVLGRIGSRSVPSILRPLLALSAAVGLFGLTVPDGIAGADSITNLKAKAAAIAQQITSDNTRLASISSVYIAQSEQYELSRDQAYTTQIKISQDQHFVSKDRHQVQKAMIDAYVAGGSKSAAILGWASNLNTLVSGSTYLGVATSQLSSTVTRFQIDEHTLKDSLLKEQPAIAREGIAANASAAARTEVLTAVQGEQTLYNSTNSQLNALVVAAAAAAEAAAAAAVAKAQAAASASAAAAAAAGPPSPTALVVAKPSASAPGSIAADFAAIRSCESSGDYALNTGNGYYGAYQFAASTWLGLGETGLPSDASPATQDAAAYLLYQRSGNSFEAWGTCAAITGVR